ncbi:hypothetical protein [Photobacterium leiognathi]|uniref:hypothetical protein n=1 Tax=Photobacterium leiognathi TaxID=553611 RepID=UPI002738202E|nr:hypothetical protein [Photobacterium leiognathi]
MTLAIIGMFVIAVLLFFVLFELKKFNSSFRLHRETFRTLAEIIERRQEHLESVECHNDETKELLEKMLSEVSNISSITNIYYDENLKDEHRRKLFNHD